MLLINRYMRSVRGYLVLKLVACVAVSWMTMVPIATAATGVCRVEQWPLWEEFVNSFVNPDGRVLFSIPPKADTSSEGQAYAMFFALIANDPVRFEKIWKWSVQNLFDADLDNNLPAWLWGEANDGSWKVLDSNSASDADLWFAYALLEAGRLWHRSDYILDAEKILISVEKNELVNLPGLGTMLLPGKVGFALTEDSWRLNPSYLPIPVLRLLAQARPDGPWTEVANNTEKLILAISPKGYAPDWVGYRASEKKKPVFLQDKVEGPRGSYDAIRVYLWAGMTSKDDPLSAPMLTTLYGMLKSVSLTGTPPESVDVNTGITKGEGPYGFSAALLPYLQAIGEKKSYEQQLERYRVLQLKALSTKEQSQTPPVYYDYSLSLFALGWVENRFRFSKDGQAKFNWEQSCFYPPVQ